jgi:outer membrane protein OmpA-like peptidoglycan-associated protein
MRNFKTIVPALFLGASVVLSCQSKKMNVNPGAHVSVDGTKDQLGHVQQSFKSASNTSEGILVSFESDVLFQTNSSFLSAAAKTELDKFVEMIKSDKISKLVVNGHTDATGTAEYNLGLSEKRAQSVKTYLVSKGISSNRISTHGYGITKPIAPNNTVEGRGKNRRVEIIIQK